MYAGRQYPTGVVLRWTGGDLLVFALIGSVPSVLGACGVALPPIPWQPIAVLGTAVAFMTGFRSNAAYGRLWEARKIWGGILNASRSFAIHLREFVGSRHRDRVHATVLRHVAWLTSLRYDLRQKRNWESQAVAANRRFREKMYRIPEDQLDVEGEIRGRLSADEWAVVQQARNRTVTLLGLHAAELRKLAAEDVIDSYRHVALSRLVTDFIDLQGKAERIKNFPYPRQFATLNHVFVWLFVLVLPFAVGAEVQRHAVEWMWMTIPLTVVVSWVFNTMDRMGSVSENPFEGSPNDVPITAMSRTIEIDILEIAGERRLPAPVGTENQILM